MRNYTTITAQLMTELFGKTRLSPDELDWGLGELEDEARNRGYTPSDIVRILATAQLWSTARVASRFPKPDKP